MMEFHGMGRSSCEPKTTVILIGDILKWHLHESRGTSRKLSWLKE
jgi:hypothetical protein